MIDQTRWTGTSKPTCATGFILVPPLTPRGLDDFVDQVVPLLQERGVYRTEQTGRTLRENLGLAS